MEMVFCNRDLDLILALVVLITCSLANNNRSQQMRPVNLGKPSYWRSHRGLKLATLVVSIVFLVSLFLYMMVITGLVFNRMDKRSWYFPTSFRM